MLLHDIAAIGDIEKLRVALQDGRKDDINARDIHGETALFRAAANNQSICIRILHENGGKLDVVNNQGDTALLKAAGAGNARSVSALIEIGASLSERNANGDTALHVAAFFNQGAVVRDLLILGADAKIANKQNRTPEQTARLVDASDALDAFREYRKNVSLIYKIKSLFSL